MFTNVYKHNAINQITQPCMFFPFFMVDNEPVYT